MPSWSADPDLIAGIAAYRRHPYCRNVIEPDCIWREGGSRLLDYGSATPDAPRVLFVPSLVNRYYVMDLMQDHSFLRYLAANGVAPCVLDWGWPEEAEQDFDLTTYVAGRLERALAFAARNGPIVLAGYCMGGLLATAAAQRRPENVRALILLATPWDFHADQLMDYGRLALILPALEPIMTACGYLPVDMLQAMFSSLEPERIRRKYRSFGRLDQSSDRASLFVAIEDWLNDGVPMAAPVARECLADWYGGNKPFRGAWRVAGEVISPRQLETPSFVAVPGRDRIVPPASSTSLAKLLKNAVIHEPGAGHVGMVAGSRARDALWDPLLAWLRQL